MKKYILETLEEVKSVYTPDLYMLKDNFLPPKLKRTNRIFLSAMKFTARNGSEENLDPESIDYLEFQPGKAGHRYRGFNEEKFLREVSRADFDNDITEIVKKEEDLYLIALNGEIELLNETSVKLLLYSTCEQLEESSEKLAKLLSRASFIDKLVIGHLTSAYEGTITGIKNKYGRLYPDLFYENSSEKSLETGKQIRSPNGLILAEGTVSPGRAKKLTKWLKEEGFVAPETQYQTIQNIFVKQQTYKTLTKVRWTGANKELKYFINGLQARSVVIKSSKATKWKDVTSVFVNDDGQEFDNTQFSGNTDSLIEKKKHKLDSVLLKFETEMKESLTSLRRNKS